MIIWRIQTGPGTKVELFRTNSTHYVRRKKKFSPKNTIPTVKVLDGKMVLCGCFSARRTGKLHHIEERMDRIEYFEILDNILIVFVGTLKMELPA